jgi:exodeoxyribonuclease VII small subunit
LEDKQAAADGSCDELSFERSLEELESIVHDLEDGQLGLADALARYEQGVKHLKRCYKLLEAAERKIELLTGVGDDGTPITEPFEETNGAQANYAGRRKRAKQPAIPPNDEDSEDDIGA